MGPHDFEIAAMNREKHEDGLRSAKNNRIASQVNEDTHSKTVGIRGRAIRKVVVGVAAVLLTMGHALQRWAGAV